MRTGAEVPLRQLHVVLNWFNELERPRPHGQLMSLQPGTRLGNYEALSDLGSGNSYSPYLHLPRQPLEPTSSCDNLEVGDVEHESSKNDGFASH